MHRLSTLFTNDEKSPLRFADLRADLSVERQVVKGGKIDAGGASGRSRQSFAAPLSYVSVRRAPGLQLKGLGQSLARQDEGQAGPGRDDRGKGWRIVQEELVPSDQNGSRDRLQKRPQVIVMRIRCGSSLVRLAPEPVFGDFSQYSIHLFF